MTPGKGGKLPSHWALNGGRNVATMDNRANISPYAGPNYGLPQKTGIYIHRTNLNGFVGATVSTGCLLLSPEDWVNFDEKVKESRLFETKESNFWGLSPTS